MSVQSCVTKVGVVAFSFTATADIWELGLHGGSDFGCILDDSCEHYLAFVCKKLCREAVLNVRTDSIGKDTRDMDIRKGIGLFFFSFAAYFMYSYMIWTCSKYKTRGSQPSIRE